MSGEIISSWHNYPRIYNLGHAILVKLFDDEVIVEEKLDGSQFSFGVFEGELKCRSKGAILNLVAPEKMFINGVDSVRALPLTPGWTYSGEYLKSPKHNTLAYNRIPNGHVMIFDVRTGEEQYLSYAEKKAEAERLGLECIPILFQGKVEGLEMFRELLETVSVLGGQKVEGVVVKQYKLFGPDGKALMGKFVSEAFREAHGVEWKNTAPNGGDVIETLATAYTSAARWSKAIQHLAEAGKITDTPQDIQYLIPEVRRDVLAECKEEIAQKLFDWAWPKIERQLTRGLPEYYKEILLRKQFEETK